MRFKISKNVRIKKVSSCEKYIYTFFINSNINF